MSAVGIVVLLVAALGVGYLVGRRSNPRVPTWQQRTSRTVLGRQALVLALLMAVSQVERSTQRRLRPAMRREPASSVNRLRRLARR
ncbi:hypothetical protein [Mycolicibacterium sp. S3B2]|uniref:hypothetical protein n=1 Tax=Mycolicibacterium sp. S3B2 TaxID=3415120 RepID=UPI003C7DE9E9